MSTALTDVNGSNLMWVVLRKPIGMVIRPMRLMPWQDAGPVIDIAAAMRRFIEVQVWGNRFQYPMHSKEERPRLILRAPTPIECCVRCSFANFNLKSPKHEDLQRNTAKNITPWNRYTVRTNKTAETMLVGSHTLGMSSARLQCLAKANVKIHVNIVPVPAWRRRAVIHLRRLLAKCESLSSDEL